MKIGIRLQQLDKMLTNNYHHIWDCCCDHGLLGMKLLQRHAAKKIHFVDIVEPLMEELQSKLQCFFSEKDFAGRWQVHCLDAATIPLPKNNRQLIIIAGVGGDRTIDLVNAILVAHPDRELEFLLCPVHHNYKVRQALISNGLGLIDECLVRENKRFYEILHVSSSAEEPISSVGSIMWDFSRQDDREYLTKMIAHYQRKSQDAGKEIGEIISAYQSLEKNSHRQ